ncbi:hypothetical protein LINGRAHAP2_LOCUS20967 [Linum grandiflorum]
MFVDNQSNSRGGGSGSGFIGKLCYVIDIVLNINPRVILFMAALCFSVWTEPGWRYMSSILIRHKTISGHSNALVAKIVNGGWLLPATAPLTLLALVQWYYVSKTSSSSMPYWIASEGLSLCVVTVIIVQLLLMAHYRPTLPDHPLFA